MGRKPWMHSVMHDDDVRDEVDDDGNGDGAGDGDPCWPLALPLLQIAYGYGHRQFEKYQPQEGQSRGGTCHQHHQQDRKSVV